MTFINSKQITDALLIYWKLYKLSADENTDELKAESQEVKIVLILSCVQKEVTERGSNPLTLSKNKTKVMQWQSLCTQKPLHTCQHPHRWVQ